jgi:hypothetical protein
LQLNWPRITAELPMRPLPRRACCELFAARNSSHAAGGSNPANAKENTKRDPILTSHHPAKDRGTRDWCSATGKSSSKDKPSSRRQSAAQRQGFRARRWWRRRSVCVQNSWAA